MIENLNHKVLSFKISSLGLLMSVRDLSDNNPTSGRDPLRISVKHEMSCF